MVTFEVLTHPQILSPNTIPLFDGSKPCKWPEGWYVDPSPNMVHPCVDFCLEACSSWAFWVTSSGIDGPCCWPKPWSSLERSCGALSSRKLPGIETLILVDPERGTPQLNSHVPTIFDVKTNGTKVHFASCRSQPWLLDASRALALHHWCRCGIRIGHVMMNHDEPWWTMMNHGVLGYPTIFSNPT